MDTPRTPDRAPELDPVPMGWIIVTWVTVVGALVAVWLGWDRIPNPMPVHWGLSGEPDRWTEKTVGRVVGQILIGGLPLAVLTPLIAYGTRLQAKSRIAGPPALDDDDAYRTAVTTNVMTPLVTKFMALITVIVMALSVTGLLGLFPGWNTGLVLLVLLAALVIWFVAALRSAQRIVVKRCGHDDVTRNTHWGMFYYNPDDSRMMVEHGTATTLNWANKSSWILIGALLTPAAVLIAIIAVAG